MAKEVTYKGISSNIWRCDQRLSELVETMIENEGEFTEDVAEYIERFELSMDYLVENLNALRRKNAAENNAISEEIKRLQKLKKSRDTTFDKLNQAAIALFKKANISKLDTPTVKMTVSEGRNKLKVDEEYFYMRDARFINDAVTTASIGLPAYYKVDISLDKSALKELIEKDGNIEGAEIVKEPFLLFK